MQKRDWRIRGTHLYVSVICQYGRSFMLPACRVYSNNISSSVQNDAAVDMHILNTVPRYSVHSKPSSRPQCAYSKNVRHLLNLCTELAKCPVHMRTHNGALSSRPSLTYTNHSGLYIAHRSYDWRRSCCSSRNVD